MKITELSVPIHKITHIDIHYDDRTATVAWPTYGPTGRVMKSANVDVDSDLFRVIGKQFLANAHGVPTLDDTTDFVGVDLAATVEFIVSSNLVGLPQATQDAMRRLGTDLGQLILTAADLLDRALTNDSASS